MYAKVFQQILDSSIAEDWQTRHVFEDLLKLCDVNGVVDMTHESIARRTNVPVEIVRKAITELEQPDKRSRNPEHEGRRIVRLDQHRDWAWHIVNYAHYRQLVSEEQRREKTRVRVANYRERHSQESEHATRAALHSVTVTPTNASNAMQREREKVVVEKTNGLRPVAFNGRLTPSQTEIADRFANALGNQWDDANGRKWMMRCRDAEKKCHKVVAELESAIKQNRIKKSPAHYAEYIWGDTK